MNMVRAFVLSCVLAGTTACAAERNQQHGVTGALLDKVMAADSKKMDLLRAEVAMMLLSYIAVDSGERTEADTIASIAALNRTALAIDCMRFGDIPDGQRSKTLVSSCGPSTDYYFFDTRMVSVDRNLLSLARSSLPTASLSSLLAALPNASAQPLSLVTPILSVAKDAAVIGWRGAAVSRDAVELEVATVCRSPATAGYTFCDGWKVTDGRNVGLQRQAVSTLPMDVKLKMTPPVDLFTAARAQSAANCAKLRSKVSDQDTVNCRLVFPEA